MSNQTFTSLHAALKSLPASTKLISAQNLFDGAKTPSELLKYYKNIKAEYSIRTDEKGKVAIGLVGRIATLKQS